MLKVMIIEDEPLIALNLEKILEKKVLRLRVTLAALKMHTHFFIPINLILF